MGVVIENYGLDAPLPLEASPSLCPHGPWEEVTPGVNPLRKALGLVTPEELAAALGVKGETLTVWRSSGNGPSHIKLGKRVFYRMDDLEIWAWSKFPEKHSPVPKPLEPLAGVDDADDETPSQEAQLPLAGN